jgi:D-glycero-alpha-D-manno-heptose-7-phosphate kinase
MTPLEVARFAHRLETEKLGLECGVQDQIASACGGVNLIRMPQYPETEVETLSVPLELQWELEQRLLVVYIGKPHQSSEVHRAVIQGLGESPETDERLQRLREVASEAAEAFTLGDFTRLGQVFDANTELQRRLHPELVCEDFETIIGLAKRFKAEGCKVNGAGGDGGSVAILCSSDMNRKRELESELIQRKFKCLPVLLSPLGLRVWEVEG